MYDKITFMKEFPATDISKYKNDPKVAWLPCFEPVPTEYLNKVESALTEIETYVKRTHRGIFSFEDVASDPTLRFILLTIKSPNARQILWIMRENKAKKVFMITCKTLFELKCKSY